MTHASPKGNRPVTSRAYPHKLLMDAATIFRYCTRIRIFPIKEPHVRS